MSSTRVHGPWIPSSPEDLENLNRVMSIFSMLSEMMDIGGAENLHAVEYKDLAEALDALAASKSVHPSDIQMAKVPGMLFEITKPQSRWPSSVRHISRLLIAVWKAQFGQRFVATPQVSPENPIPGKNGGSGPPRQFKQSYRASGSATQSKAQRMLDLQPPVVPVARQRVDRPPATALPPNPPLRGLTRSLPLRLTPTLRVAAHLQLPVTPYSAGAMTFRPGDWWTGPIAAAKDGIIDWKPKSERVMGLKELTPFKFVRHGVRRKAGWRLPVPSALANYDEADELVLDPDAESESDVGRHEAAAITFDEFGAYAVVLLGGCEESSSDLSMALFKAHPKDPGCRSLMKNNRISDPVRILRTPNSSISSPRGKSPSSDDLNPAAGVRFDGLYKVHKFKVKMEKCDILFYEYELHRLEGQRRLEDFLAVPSRKMILDAIEKRKMSGLADLGNHTEDDLWGFDKQLIQSIQLGKSKLSEVSYAKAQQEYVAAELVRLLEKGGE